MTLALVNAMTVELHQATTSATQVSSQYQAESGAQDSLAYITSLLIDHPPGFDPGQLNQSCADVSKVATYSGDSSSIKCNAITANGGVTNGFLPKDQSVQFDLSGTTKLDGGSLEIDWDQGRRTSVVGTRTFSNNDFNPQGAWSGPPALEITVATTPAVNGENPQSIYLLPQCYSFIDLSTPGACDQKAGGAPPKGWVYFGYIWAQNKTATAASQNCPTNGVASANCKSPATVDCFGATGDDYDCKVYLPGWDTGNVGVWGLPRMAGTTQYILRIKALDTDADFQVKLRDCGDPDSGTCNEIPLALPQASIDVTASVGGAYQRVQEQAQVRSNPLNVTNYALLGANNICKDVDLFNEGNGYVPRQHQCQLIDTGS